MLDRFEEKLNSYSGNLSQAAIELAKMWRTDKVLRHLEALLLAMDLEHVLIISGKGDVIEPDESIAAIGSGGNYALSAAKALYRNTDMDSEAIARRSLKLLQKSVFIPTITFIWKLWGKPGVRCF